MDLLVVTTIVFYTFIVALFAGYQMGKGGR